MHSANGNAAENVPLPVPVQGARRPRRKSAASPEERPAIWVGYGKLLRRFRKRAGLTQEQLAERLGYSVEQTASVEQGRRPATAAFTAAAERVLDAGGVLEDLQEEVDFAKLPEFFRDFGVIEAEAVSRFDYDPLLVPGLLQTSEYARTMFEGHIPPLSPETIDNHVDARLSRHKLLTKTPLVEFSFIIGELALRNIMGSREIMQDQYEHLLAAGQLRNVAVQVMPSQTGFHPGLDGPMVLVETDQHQHFGYFESQNIGHVVSDPSEASMFALRYGKLRSLALNVEESASLIERLAGER